MSPPDSTIRDDTAHTHSSVRRNFRVQDWNLPFRLAVLLVLSILLVYLGLGDWPIWWAGGTLVLEAVFYAYRRRARRLRIEEPGGRRIHITAETVAHILVLAWIAGAAALYLTDQPATRMTALLLLAAIGMTVSWQPGQLLYVGWLNAAMVGTAMILLTGFTADDTTGYLRFAAALLFSGNIFSVAVASARSNAALNTAEAEQEALSEEPRQARRDAESGRDAAEEMAKTKEDFLAVMSHEVRTPLNGVLAMADALVRTDLTAEQRRQVTAIAQSGRMLLDIVNEVLSIARIEAGEMRLNEEAIDLRDLLESGLLPWRIRAEENGLRFRVEIGDDVPQRVYVDSVKLKQILANFIANAVKFTSEGGIAVTAAREDGAEGAQLRFAVSDTGAGIPEAERQRVFERFAQIDTSRNRSYEGTGLGLSICKDFVELMGGEIGVDSREGEGSSFWFTLPCVPAETGGQDAAEPAAAEPSPSAPVSEAAADPELPLRILVADDNAINRSVIEALLSPTGATIVMASDGAEAVQAIERQRFDLALMDVRMPGLDGVEATRRIRALPDGAELPIITLTAGDEPSEERDCFAAGADAHLTKPIDSSALYAKIAELTKAEAPVGPAQ